MGYNALFGHFGRSHERTPHSIVLAGQGQDENTRKRGDCGGGALMAQSQPSLPTNRAFLVQFRIQATEASPAYASRVEHVVSGDESRFQSLGELLAVMIRVVKHGQKPADHA